MTAAAEKLASPVHAQGHGAGRQAGVCGLGQLGVWRHHHAAGPGQPLLSVHLRGALVSLQALLSPSPLLLMSALLSGQTRMLPQSMMP